MAKGVTKKNLFDGLDPQEPKNVHNHDDVYVYNDVHTHDDVVTKKTTKNKRIQILTYSNLVRRMDAYAKRKGLSRAEVFEMAVSEFLDKNT